MMIAKGTFEVTATPEPPFDVSDGIALGRMTIDKRFAGPLEGTGRVHMIYARGPAADAGGYAAIERIDAALDGRRGTFVVVHQGVMAGGAQTIDIVIVPQSGTGELRGISGRMTIEIIDGQHHYGIEYQLTP